LISKLACLCVTMDVGRRLAARCLTWRGPLLCSDTRLCGGPLRRTLRLGRRPLARCRTLRGLAAALLQLGLALTRPLDRGLPPGTIAPGLRRTLAEPLADGGARRPCGEPFQGLTGAPLLQSLARSWRQISQTLAALE
jgi:hypothetical protein